MDCLKIDLYIHTDSGKLDQIIKMLTNIQGEQKAMADTLDDVLNDVTAETTVDQSIITLLNGISAQLAEAGTNPAKLAQIRSAIAANTAAITAAVVANTPVAPPPPPPVPAA